MFFKHTGINLYRMKKLIIYLIFTNFYCFSQNKSTSAIYDLIIVMDDETKEIDKKYGYIQKAIDAAKELDYILVFNSNEANFYQKENNSLDNTSKYMANAICNIAKNNYINIEKKHILKENLNDGYLFKKDEFLVKDTLYTNWELTEEKKVIGNYLCFKATTKKKTIKLVNEKEKDFYETVTAWFCPSLPYSFGPSNYAGLPGLILELQERDFVFIIKSINFDVEKNVIPLQSDKIISSKEYYELKKKRMELLKEMAGQK